ncbi:MAG TPA: terminase large subunit, partial [Streptomyces sp.]|nr:terminase large subunit [Streptomyces sp.]
HLIPMEVWKANGGYPDPRVFEECPVYGGLDLSSRLDLTALVLVARDAEFRWHVDAHFWTPADTLHERALRDRVPYDQWERAGLLTAVPGKSID